jgi:hypothetical protein
MTSEGRIGSVPEPDRDPPLGYRATGRGKPLEQVGPLILPASAWISPASCASSAEPEGPFSCGNPWPLQRGRTSLEVKVARPQATTRRAGGM